MKEILGTLITLHAQTPIDRAATNDKLLSTVIGLFVTGVVLCNVVYYPMVIRVLNKSIKGTRALLLLLPDDVITGIRVLKEAMVAITKKLSS